MMQLFIIAFMIGIAGSFHCVGMCGPIALSLPLNNDDFFTKFTGALLYNTGRIVTYTFFGFVFGLIGRSFALFGFQQYLSVAAGLAIIIFVVIPKKYTAVNTRLSNSFFGKVRQSIGNLFSDKNRSSLFAIGLLNGLLPCGLVYMAITGAIASGDIIKSMVFMAAFGLGTLPVMWSVVFFGNYIGVPLRKKIRNAYPYLITLMACLLILRGLGLGIPYVSPKLMTENKEIRGCCTKP